MFALYLILLSCLAVAGDSTFNDLDKVIHKAIESRTLPGAVVIVGSNKSLLHKASYGKRDSSQLNTIETIYDLASLTKVIATATSLIILEEEGRILKLHSCTAQAMKPSILMSDLSF
jgi:CubicO group peptidase (beta-lactamase class C family)